MPVCETHAAENIWHQKQGKALRRGTKVFQKRGNGCQCRRGMSRDLAPPAPLAGPAAEAAAM